MPQSTRHCCQSRPIDEEGGYCVKVYEYDLMIYRHYDYVVFNGNSAAPQQNECICLIGKQNDAVHIDITPHPFFSWLGQLDEEGGYCVKVYAYDLMIYRHYDYVVFNGNSAASQQNECICLIGKQNDAVHIDITPHPFFSWLGQLLLLGVLFVFLCAFVLFRFCDTRKKKGTSMQSPSLSEIPTDPISKSEDSNPESSPSIITAPDVSNEADLSVSIAEPEVENSSELEQSDDSLKINPPFSTTTEDTGKVAWRDFLSNFKNRSTHIPFPELIKGDEVTVDEADMMLHDSGIDDALKNLENPEFCRNIAKKFLEKFPPPESDWKGASLLLRADPDTAYWVAGDIHAKTDALAKICAFIYCNKTKDRNVLILLGDFIDRGDKPVETLAFIEAIKNESLFPGFEVITLKGNHDVGLSRNELGDYVSMVSPAETADFFQRSKANGENLIIEADAAMRLAAVSPRMCELTGIDPNDPARTMLFVHGGVPHVDLQEKLYAARNEIPQKEPFLSALDRESIPESLRRGCAEDFTWIRFAKDLPLKKPNRGSRGCEIGTEDVAQYIFLHRILTTRDISFIFRGHDHERDGFACYSAHQDMNPSKKPFVQRDCHVLTLNAMEPDLSSNGIFRERDIALAQWSVGEPVRLHKILTRHIHFNKNDDTPPDVADVPRVDTKEAE